MNDARVLPYVLIAPAALFLAAFFLVPFVQVGIEAFSQHGEWSTGNFQAIMNDWKFWPAMKNTFILTAIVVPLQLILALAMATLVLTLKTGRDAALYIFTIPLGVSDLAAGIVWLAILDQTGFLNSLLHAFGYVEHPTLILSYQNVFALFAAIIVAELWRATAIVLVILVAGMTMIPKEYYEAAEVFGAGAWTRFVRITLPLLKPSLQTALILRAILAFEVFGIVMVLAGANLPVLMSETFQWQFALQDRGGAAAYALVILAVSVALTLTFLITMAERKEVTR